MPTLHAAATRLRTRLWAPGPTSAVLRAVKVLAALAVLLLGAISATVLVSRSFTIQPESEVEIAYLPGDGKRAIDPESAAAILFDDRKKTKQFGLTPEGSFWIGLTATAAPSVREISIEIRQLRGTEMSFWQLIPRTADRGAARPYPITVLETRSGIAFEALPTNGNPVRIVGRIRGESVVKPQVVIQASPSLRDHLIDSNRLGGLLYGGMMGLALFGAVVSLLNRDKTFFLLSALLVTSLRIAGFNYGWDLQWIGWSTPAEFVPAIKNITLLLHLLLTLALFEELFGRQLHRTRSKRVFATLYAVYCCSALLHFVLPAHASIALIWVLAIGTTATVFTYLAKILSSDLSTVAVWYGLSWLVTGVGMFGEILNATGYGGAITQIMNSQTAAISSAVLSGVALSAKLQLERQARISAQNSAITALQRFRQNYNATPVGIFSMRLDGTLLEHNPTFGSMFVVDGRRGSKVGMNWATLLSRDALQGVAEQADGTRMMDAEMAVRRIGDKKRWFHVRAVRKADRYEGWIEDISARKEAEDQLKFLVHHDSLTGLLNRRGFEVELLKATHAAGTRVICLAYVDLDRFKLVNDLFGHAAGDQILRQMSARMREVIAPPHVPARVGGDEFVVVIDSLPLEEARALCERLRVSLSDRAYHYQDKAFSVTASIGLIRMLECMRPADALTASDRACAEAKRLGGGSVISFDSSSSELMDYLEEIKLVAGMKERLPVENFFTQLQPIVSLRNPRTSLCYEVLIRMRDASGAVMPPSRFIPAAERNGLMTQIDRWVLRSTLEWLDAQPVHRNDVDFCTINLSGASLNDEKFLQDTIGLIRDHSHSTRKICFEITESVALYDLNTTRRFVDTVKSFGAMVALDDFGAGYTSFSYLKELPADLVKIDGNFIRDVNSNPANFAITRAVVELAHELGMGCVAEWAENADIVRSLIQLRIDYAQGFGLCRPLERERILAVSNSAALIGDLATADLVLGRGNAPVESVWGAALPI